MRQSLKHIDENRSFTNVNHLKLSVNLGQKNKLNAKIYQPMNVTVIS